MKALIRHSIAVYEALEIEAKTETYEGNELTVYRGHVSKLYATLGIAQAYYTDIFDQLGRQGSVTYLQRGSRSVETVIVLHYPPTPEGFDPRRKSDLTSAEEFANMVEQHRLHVKLIGGINIVEAFREVDRRLERLEEINRGAENVSNTIQSEKQ